ncbi:hypothetical protein Anapl_00356 [Anas platyrhynchos]|uniref:Uncharacterized protein n=1 Tax=Anas platyrhynchos TaxID=8839 RepID=R0LHH3_ANAPL|nr:hypothetical protein Anapl_00356 [Anas platyrhynchos]
MGQPATGSLYLTAKQQALVMVIILPSISSSKSELTDSWALAVTRRSVTQALVPSSCDATAPAGESPTGVASPLAGTGIAAILKVSRAKHEMAWLSPCWGRSVPLSPGRGGGNRPVKDIRSVRELCWAPGNLYQIVSLLQNCPVPAGAACMLML